MIFMGGLYAVKGGVRDQRVVHAVDEELLIGVRCEVCQREHVFERDEVLPVGLTDLEDLRNVRDPRGPREG
jgi:hypothetical protein